MYHSLWDLLVPVTGLEPVRCRQRWILSPLRLPFHHTGRCVFIHLLIFGLIPNALRECRCPVAVPEISCSRFAREISTAAHRSDRFFRRRRRSPRSPDSHQSAIPGGSFKSATSTIPSHRQVCLNSIVHPGGKCKGKFDCQGSRAIALRHFSR